MFVIHTATHTPQRARRVSIILAIVSLLALIVILFSTLPPLRRMLANPAAAIAQEGVSQIVVRADPDQNHVYYPPAVRVSVGTTITWTFADRGESGAEAVPHNVVSEQFASDVLEEGTYSHTFSQPGTYRYTCTLHPFMDGRVEVVAATQAL